MGADGQQVPAIAGDDQFGASGDSGDDDMIVIGVLFDHGGGREAAIAASPGRCIGRPAPLAWWSTTTTFNIATASNRLTCTSGALARTYSYDATGNALT